MIYQETEISLQLKGTAFQDYEKSDLLFFDIETTGFRADSSQLYLIGAICFRDGAWRLSQWLAQEPGQEKQILEAFLEIAKNFTILVHFNGERFDVPYLREKCGLYRLADRLSHMAGRDLYRMIRPLKKLLGLTALNQRSLEEFLGIFRKDPYDGGELIRVYRQYVKKPDPETLRTLLLHNYEDLLGMLSVISLLAYLPVLTGSFRVTGGETEKDALLIRAQLPFVLPKPFSFRTKLYYLKGEGNLLSTRVYAKQKALKYFFADYWNYYYLPAEDMAIHKSVAAYVDKAYRKPAKASNCYSRREGFYLPQYRELFEPVFREEYQDRLCWFACREEFLKDRKKLKQYLKHLIEEEC